MALTVKEAIDLKALIAHLALEAGYNDGTFISDIGAVIGGLSNFSDTDLATNQILTGAGAAAVNSRVTNTIATGVGQTVTLANGLYKGQLKFITAKSGYGTNTTFVTPAAFADGTKVTLSANFSGVVLVWDGAVTTPKWHVAFLSNAVVS
jgi:hypothetical protein